MKTVLISGASSGIGAGIAKKMHAAGWKTLLLGRNQERLKQVQSELENSETFICDLNSPDEISSLSESLKNSSLNALINNAGIYHPQSVDEDQDEIWQKYFQSNLMSAVRLTRAFWPQLKESKGSIVNISSTLGLRPIVNTSAYSALKAAMNNWTQSLALEGAPYGIRANAICPGIVDTPIHSFVESSKPEDREIYAQVQKAQPLGRTGKPQDIASMVSLLCSAESNWTTGCLINIDGGILLNS